MRLSRLRLRLAGWFAIAFLAGLLLLSVTLFVYIRRQSDARLTRELAAEAVELADAIALEYKSAPDSGVAAAVKATFEEWPAGPEAFGVYAADGQRLGITGPRGLAQALPLTWPSRHSLPVDLPGPEPRPRLVPLVSTSPTLQVVAVGTTARLAAEMETLALWLVFSIPATILLSLVAGYVLSSRALRPVGQLEHAIGQIGPDDLDRRLVVHSEPDELDRLAARFNALLERLQESQAQSRRFLEQAAHQIRTPLTLLLGEAELALERQTLEARDDALRRIRLAATQMRRRVDELLLLARASAGEHAPLTDTIELDGLAFECADLMRGRAQQLGRRLELTRVEPVVVRGSEPLLREAVVELLENACRHGSSGQPVGLSVFREGGEAVIQVSNAIGDQGSEETGDPARQHLGLDVVRWIASEHGGRLAQHQASDSVLTVIHLPT